ncbi:thioredoxin [Natronomonas pharaonis DSM 2160]|uniref:Thioredoxin n=1 Tax=Natronomonas pharaonis (strain ATCC 35678 / DSM 2160 / CIP 103997 / JCM 8858 / NBRC 14720 / NCIMB 2260 / Gabara) TaxID=348780 RepID=A0A1U7EY66_NATPD|nr:thioredoxin [Natronomonas pharaonis]CAI50151.1 thioredoxin [Natronomonas pharaonis DSM 2160]
MSSESASTSPSEPIPIEETNGLDAVTSEYDTVLVDFYADWCGPCQMMEPAVESVAESTDAAVIKVDVDANQDLAAEFGVQGVPTLVVFVDGEVAEQVVGAQSEDRLRELVDR